MFSIHWSTLAEESFSEEVSFILRKWNHNEVEKFTDLAYDVLDSLSKTPTIGKYFSKGEFYSLVISKQTTLYYKVSIIHKKIELLLFWNNSKNPDDLIKLL